MNRKLIYFFIISCSSLFAKNENEYWTNISDIDLNDFVYDFDGEKLPVEVYQLKNNYTLYFRPSLCKEDSSDSIYTQIYLKKNNQLILLDLPGDGCLLSRFLYRFVVDFDDYFILALYPSGSGNPVDYYLINKQTNKLVLNYCSYLYPQDKKNL